MNRVATASCEICFTHTPKNEMVLKTRLVQAGESVGVSFNPKKFTTSRFSVRSHYRKKKMWICNSCWSQRPNYIKTLFLTFFLGPVFIPIYLGYGFLGRVIYLLTFGVFGLSWFFCFCSAFFGQFKNKDGLPNNRLF
jgi:hypothetical protein